MPINVLLVRLAWPLTGRPIIRRSTDFSFSNTRVSSEALPRILRLLVLLMRLPSTGGAALSHQYIENISESTTSRC